jgi:hypothetical protein
VPEKHFTQYRKRGGRDATAKKKGSTASHARPRDQIVPEPKERIGGKPKPGPKHIHRKDITLPPTVAEAAQKHADELGMTDVNYYNAAILAMFQRVLTGDHGLIVPQDACAACGNRTKSITRPNAPPESGFTRVRVGVRFTTNVSKMMLQLAEDWFGGVWSHAFEASVRGYLGKKNPPPEGKGRVPGVSLRGVKGKTAEERVVRALAQAAGEEG